MNNTVLDVGSPDDLAALRLKVFAPCLINVDSEVRPTVLGIGETRPLVAFPSRNDKPRLNLLVPSVNPKQMFGGLTTAHNLFENTVKILGEDFDRRIIATDAAIDDEGYARLKDYTPTAYAPTIDRAANTVVDAFGRQGRLDLRAGDMFIATAWWTADFAISLEKDRRRLFGGDLPFVYLIQDDEPYFYGWGSKFALAEATYRKSSNIRAVINSEELLATMTRKYKFKSAVCIPYELNAEVSRRLKATPRRRDILVYGRPSVSRNAFELICDGIFRWQQSDPVRASRWRIVFAGEAFSPSWAVPVQNCEVAGKLTLEAYADLLNSAAVGVSLMLSPHPSYPPLEMAEAGLVTVVNHYEGKDLRSRFPEIISLPYLDAEALAEALERAVDQAEPMIGKRTDRRSLKKPALKRGLVFDAGALAAQIQSDLKILNDAPESNWWRKLIAR